VRQARVPLRGGFDASCLAPVRSSTPLGVTYVLHQHDSVDMLLRTVIKSNRRGEPMRHRTAEQSRCGRDRVGFSMLE